MKAYSSHDYLAAGDTVFLAKVGTSGNQDCNYHYCEPQPLRPNDDPFDEMLFGHFNSPAHGGRAFASGKAVITAGPFPGAEDRCGNATVFYTVERRD
ncbi:MAG TPA: hypothetical protein VF867_03955 [Arthrobacter sp.]